ASSVERPLTPAEQQRLDRARAQENASRASTSNRGDDKAQRKADEQAEKEALKAQPRPDDLDRNPAETAKQAQETNATEKAKIDKRKGKRDAEKAKADAGAAKKQAELDRGHQKALEEAAAKAKEAQARYEALAKSQR